MNKIDAMLAPRALTAAELVSVTTPHLIAYAVAHRAFIHACVLQDGLAPDSAVVHACEGALVGIVDDAMDSVNEWLRDMEADGQPRFYRKASVKEAVAKLAGAVGQMAARQETPADLNTLIELLNDRDRGTTETILALTGEN